MARELSLNARTSFNAEVTEDVWAVLATIEHPQLVTPLRISSDPTVRLSEDPLRYGTRSRGEVYEFVMMSVGLPDDQQGRASAASLVLANVAEDMAKVVRSVTSPGAARLELIWASEPDAIEETWELVIVKARYDAERVTLELSREPVVNEPYPSQRMTRDRFPGLFR